MKILFFVENLHDILMVFWVDRIISEERLLRMLLDAICLSSVANTDEPLCCMLYLLFCLLLHLAAPPNSPM
jgi:hypothetical protein